MRASGASDLAGIVFSDTVSFRTKAAGEAEETEVTFNAALMRELMSPGKGSELTAEALLVRCVSGLVREADPQLPPFFEVKLRGFKEPPDECEQPKLMARFVSQVAPVPYREDFEHRIDIHAHAHQFGIGIEEVALVIEAPGQGPQRVFKPYSARYEVRDAVDLVPLVELQYFKSPTDRWWGSLGKKAEPGSYLRLMFGVYASVPRTSRSTAKALSGRSSRNDPLPRPAIRTGSWVRFS
jgi:molecular chaperone HtpG